MDKSKKEPQLICCCHVGTWKHYRLKALWTNGHKVYHSMFDDGVKLTLLLAMAAIPFVGECVARASDLKQRLEGGCGCSE